MKKDVYNLHEDLIKKGLKILNEDGYRDYKKDETKTNRLKLNTSLVEINKHLKVIETIIDNNIKLKEDLNLHGDFYKSAPVKFSKISERLIRIGNKIKEFAGG